MDILIFLIIFIFGTIVGSFLNVLIDRLPVGQNPWRGRSRCDHCQKTLSPMDLIPLFSFLILKGKCRYCHKKLSWQYPLIEFATGLMFISIFNFSVKAGSSFAGQFFLLSGGQAIFNKFSIIQFVNLMSLIIIFSSFLAIFVADIKFQIIPDELIISSLIGSLVLLFIRSVFFHILIYENFISAIGAAGFFLLIFILTKGKGMGFGDVKLAFILGLFLGYPNILIGLYLAFLTGAVVSIILILGRIKKLKSKIAFGPFLLIGTIISYFYGGTIWTQFLKFFI